MAVASVVLSFLSLLNCWLVLPIFVLPPIAFYLGLLSHRANRAKSSAPTKLETALSLLPMFFAVLMFWLDLYVMTTQYQA